MMVYMDSKTFYKYYLEIESDKDILDAQYVLVSSRIMKRKSENVMSAKSILFPSSSVYLGTKKKEMKEAYLKQVEDNEVFIASIIMSTIKEGYNVIFLCSKKEMKFPYLKYLSEYVLLNFGYPIYDYLSYISGCEIIDYDINEVLRICKEIKKEAKNKQKERMLEDPELIKKEIRRMGKKELDKYLKKHNMYEEGLSKAEKREFLFEAVLLDGKL